MEAKADVQVTRVCLSRAAARREKKIGERNDRDICAGGERGAKLVLDGDGVEISSGGLFLSVARLVFAPCAHYFRIELDHG